MYMSRTFEYQADNFAVTYGHGKSMKSALTNLFKRNKGPLTADPLYSAMNHSHPTLLERLQNIDHQFKGEWVLLWKIIINHILLIIILRLQTIYSDHASWTPTFQWIHVLPYI